MTNARWQKLGNNEHRSWNVKMAEENSITPFFGGGKGMKYLGIEIAEVGRSENKTYERSVFVDSWGCYLQPICRYYFNTGPKLDA